MEGKEHLLKAGTDLLLDFEREEEEWSKLDGDKIELPTMEIGAGRTTFMALQARAIQAVELHFDD